MADINDLLLKVGIEGIDDFVRQLELVTKDAVAAKKGIDESLGKSFINLKDLSQSFMDGLAQGLPGVGTAFKLVTNPAQGLADVARSIGGAIGGWVESADEAAKVEAQLDARIKSTGGAAGLTRNQLIEMAESLAEVTLYEDDAIKSSEALLLTFTKVGGDIFPRAQAAVTDLATAMGTDLNSATMQLGKALNDPIGGIGALSRAGVQFSDEQKKMIAGFVETNQVAKAQEIILKELETQVGGAAKAAADAGSGPWKQFKKSLGEIGETIGSWIIPVMNTLAMVLKPLTPILLPLAAAFGVATIAVIAYNSAIGASILSAAKMVATAIPSMISGLTGMATAAMAALGPIGLLAVGIAAVTAAVVLSGPPGREMIAVWDELETAIAGSSTQLEEFDKSVERWHGFIDEMIQKTQMAANMNIMLANSFRAMNIASGTASLDSMNEKLKELTEAYGASGDAVEKLSLANQILNLKEQIKDADTLAKLEEQRNAALDAQKKALEELAKQQKALEEERKRGVGTLADLQFRLGKIQEQIKTTSPDSGLFMSLVHQADLLQGKIDKINASIALQTSDVATTGAAPTPVDPGVTNEMARGWRDVAVAVGEANTEIDKHAVYQAKVGLAMQTLEDNFKGMGQTIKETVGAAFGDLAFNMGQAIAFGQDLGKVMKKFIADMITQIGKMVGMALINTAMTAPFPLSIAFLTAGLAVLGLSGLLSGLLSKDKKGATGGGFNAPGGSNAQAPSAATGLSSFEGGDFGQPVIQTIIQVDGQSLAKAVNKANANIDQRRNG